jgi:hypothetical protein
VARYRILAIAALGVVTVLATGGGPLPALIMGSIGGIAAIAIRPIP